MTLKIKHLDTYSMFGIVGIEECVRSCCVRTGVTVLITVIVAGTIASLKVRPRGKILS